MSDYIDKEKFSLLLKEYVEKRDLEVSLGKPMPKIPDSIAQYIMDIVNNTSNRWNFRRYTYRDEMVSDGIFACIKAMKNYNISHEKDNPFGYFSMICWRAFQQRIKKEHAEQAGKESLMQDIDTVTYSQQENENYIVDTTETLLWYDS